MKKLILITFALFITVSALKAQRTIVVCGQIDRAVANQTVWVSFFSNPSTCTVQDTTATDSLGKYSYTFTIGVGCANNGVRVNMLDCKNDTLWNTQFYDTSRGGGGPDTLKANFKYCDTCKVKSNFGHSVSGKLITFNSSASLGSPNKFKWYFGDVRNSTSALQNPSFVYDSLNKVYSVCLVVEDTNTGCKDSICKTVSTTVPPCFNFHANFNDSINGSTAIFNSTSHVSANKFRWTFGNGQSGTGQNPTHIYNASGTYTVCLIAEDTTKRCSDTICRQITIGSGSPCSGFNANFIESVRGNTATYINTSSSSANKFSWTFGNGQSSTAKSPTAVYSSTGVYTVCLIARDTINNCTDTTCRQVTIGSTLCSGFNANFSDSIKGDTAYYTSTSSSTANKFIWQFGDGQTSTSQNPMHIYAKDSVYTVCLIAEDTVKRCIDTTCRSITIRTNSLCSGFNADFSFSVNCDSVDFVNSSSSSATVFNWTFGNSNSSTQASPSTTYNGSGTYTVCLIAEDTRNRCSDTICKTVQIKNSLEGTIFRNNNQLADSGIVWLIEMTIDSSTNDTTLTAIDSAYFTQPNATYKFDNITSGDYLIKAALLPGASFYSNRMPTYYVKETRWDKATFINVNKPCVNADIVLKAGTNPGGAGFVGGLVKLGANKVGDPLNKVLVLLYNNDGSPFGFTYTDINGNYEFDNVAYGDYTVVVDVLGKHSEEYKASINANNPKDYNGNFEVNTKDVRLSKDATGISSIVKGKLKIYPNPTSNNATILFNANKGGTASITVMDLTGKTVLNQTTKVDKGNNEAELNVNELSNGLYIVTINMGTTVYVGRIGINR